MKLIDLLVRELPKRGGWPDGVGRISMHADGRIFLDGEVAAKKFKLPRCSDGWSGKLPFEYTNEVTREQYESALAAAQQPAWDGEGLPPVGCECEYETKFSGWQPVRIELIKSDGIAFTWLANSEAYNGLDCVGVQKAGSFRPIRSEADKKRDKIASALVLFLDSETDIDNPFRMKDVEGFMDYIAAGKIPGVKLGDQ